MVPPPCSTSDQVGAIRDYFEKDEGLSKAVEAEPKLLFYLVPTLHIAERQATVRRFYGQMQELLIVIASRPDYGFTFLESVMDVWKLYASDAIADLLYFGFQKFHEGGLEIERGLAALDSASTLLDYEVAKRSIYHGINVALYDGARSIRDYAVRGIAKAMIDDIEDSLPGRETGALRRLASEALAGSSEGMSLDDLLQAQRDNSAAIEAAIKSGGIAVAQYLFDTWKGNEQVAGQIREAAWEYLQEHRGTARLGELTVGSSLCRQLLAEKGNGILSKAIYALADVERELVDFMRDHDCKEGYSATRGVRIALKRAEQALPECGMGSFQQGIEARIKAAIEEQRDHVMGRIEALRQGRFTRVQISELVGWSYIYDLQQGKSPERANMGGLLADFAGLKEMASVYNIEMPNINKLEISKLILQVAQRQIEQTKQSLKEIAAEAEELCTHLPEVASGDRLPDEQYLIQLERSETRRIITEQVIALLDRRLENGITLLNQARICIPRDGELGKKSKTEEDLLIDSASLALLRLSRARTELERRRKHANLKHELESV